MYIYIYIYIFISKIRHLLLTSYILVSSKIFKGLEKTEIYITCHVNNKCLIFYIYIDIEH